MAAEGGVSAEELAADCPYINEYCEQRHRGLVRCSWLKLKGRILLSSRTFQAGEIIFREPPLHIVAEQPGNPAFDRLKELCAKYNKVFEYEPLWYWTALNSLKPTQLPPGETRLKPITADQQRKLLLLFHSDVTQPSKASIELVKEMSLESHATALELEHLVQVWILNCFEHSESPLGYSAYFMSSFMSHSCLPNAVWHYEGDNFVLRARSAIQDGDEITVSYLSEDALLESTGSRRKHLRDSKHFECTCVRCGSGRDLSRGFKCPACTGVMYHNHLEDRPGLAVLAPCEACGRVLAASDFVGLCVQEKWFQSKLDDCEQKMEKAGSDRSEIIQALEEALGKAEGVLSQHFLLDKAWTLLSDLYSRSALRQRDAESVVRKRIAFEEVAYPGLSGSRAWTLEGYADMILRHKGVVLEPEVKVPSEAVAKALAATVPRIYQDSLHILRLLFGNRHDYFSAVHRKAIELDAELKRFGCAA